MRSIVFGFLVLAFSPGTWAQTSQPTTRGTKTASTTSRPTTDPTHNEARKLLQKAISWQVGKLPRGSVTSFDGEFEFLVNTPATEKKAAQRVEGKYLQKWAFRTDRGKRQFAYRRTIDTDLSDWRSTLVSDFDDRIFGFDGKRPISVSDKKDRKRIVEEKRAAKRLFQLLFLNEMRPIDGTFRIINRNVKCRVLIGNPKRVTMGSDSATIIAFENLGGQKLKLWINTAKNAKPEVMKAEVIDPAIPFFEKNTQGKPRQVPEKFELAVYAKSQLPTGEAIRFPTRMRYSIGKREVMVITVPNSMSKIRINGIKDFDKVFSADN